MSESYSSFAFLVKNLFKRACFFTGFWSGDFEGFLFVFLEEGKGDFTISYWGMYVSLDCLASHGFMNLMGMYFFEGDCLVWILSVFEVNFGEMFSRGVLLVVICGVLNLVCATTYGL